MITLNTNYDELYRQIKNIEDRFLDCNSLNSAAVYYATYQSLVDFYFRATLQNPCNKKVNHNKFVKYSGIQRLNALSKKRINHFIESRKKHLSYISSVFFEFSDILNEFIDSDYYEYLYFKGMPNISVDEGFDILYSFFDECCPKVGELFDAFLEEDKFFMLPEVSLYSNRDGCTIYNSVDNVCDVFLKPNVRSLELLSLVIHELSHVEDMQSYASQSSSINTSLYQMRSPFCEVPAFYNQFRFYEYLLKNDIYKDAAIADWVNNLVMSIESMDNLLLFSMYPSKKLQKQSVCIPKCDVLNAILEERAEDIPIEFDSTDIIDENISLDDSVQYSYGPLFAMTMMDDEQLYNKFLMIRDGYFDSDKLSYIGLSSDEVQQKVIKKSQDFFGKY